MLKGWYFATGQFTPFQDYGFLTNHMPLAFLIPGYVLKWFGPTLLTARLYALVLGLLGLAAVWMVANRLAGKWWAAFAVWAVALNVAQVRIYSLALSQVLVAALVALVLLLSVRRQLMPWQALLAGLLCGVLMMVRINMFPLAGLWLAYIFVQQRRLVWPALGGLLLVVGIVHALYWPNILRMWAYWLPQSLFPFLEPYYTPWDKFSGYDLLPDLSWLFDLSDYRWVSIHAFWLAYRYNFIALTAVLLNLLFWPRWREWPDTFTRNTALFLNVAFIALTFVHMWAALGGQSCQAFCFSGYITFFSYLGILAMVATAPYWARNLSTPRALLALLGLALVATGVGFATANMSGEWLANVQVPRISGGSFPLWGLLNNKWNISLSDARVVLPAAVGMLTGLLILGSAWAYLRFDRKAFPASLSRSAWLAFFVLGYLLTPTPLLSLGDKTLQCGGDAIRAYEDLAVNLRRFVQPGDRLYFHGPNSPAILLYLPGVQIFPQQMNNTFAFNNEDPNADTDRLLRFGYWNQVIKERWIQEADWILVEERRYVQWEPVIEEMKLDIVLITEPLEECTGVASRQVLLRVPKD